MQIVNGRWITLESYYHSNGSLSIGENLIQLNSEYDPSILIMLTKAEFSGFKLGILGFLKLIDGNVNLNGYKYIVEALSMRYDNRGEPYSQGLSFEVENSSVYIEVSELRRFINEYSN